ncbi:MAG: AAA family ATPase, partial [Bacteroidota bacterium]
LFAVFLAGDHLVAFFLKLKNGHPEQIDEARAWLKIGDYLSQKVGTYSTGMKKKLALLLACLGSPSWLLLDEPFIGLDPEAKEGLITLIQTKRSQGINLALASHQPIVLEKLEPTAYWRIDEGHMEALSEHEVKYWLQRILAEEI